MVKSIGTSGCVVELIKVVSDLTDVSDLMKDEYSKEDIELLRQAAFAAKDLGSRTRTFGHLDNITAGAEAELDTISRLKSLEGLEGMLFNNVVLKEKEKFTQLDHVLVGNYGVVIIDSKKLAKVKVDEITKQMDNESDALHAYVNQYTGLRKKSMKTFVALYSSNAVQGNGMFIYDVRKITEHLKERVIDCEDVKRIQQVVKANTIKLFSIPGPASTKCSYATEAEVNGFYFRP